MRVIEGALVAGRYELREQIGAGGTGVVFRAHDLVLDREVAVKRLLPGADDHARARLRIEARLSALLAHPGIARIHDFGEDGDDGEAVPYLVMEYVEGSSLRDVLREVGPMDPQRVMGIVAQVADALEAAHALGIVHRDVKPSNILVRPDGTVTLIDFGIARSGDIEPVTLTGTIVGTVDYISPEQADGAGATARSDLYALGLVAYECLTGSRPLRRESQVATLLAHLNEDVPPLPRAVPEAVRTLVHRLADRDPRRRPADAATTARLARASMALPAATARTATGPERSRRRRPGLLWWAAVPAALILVCVLAAQGSDVRQTVDPRADAAAVPASSAPADASPVRTVGPTSAPTSAAPAVGRAGTHARATRPSHPHPKGHRAKGHGTKGGAKAHGRAKRHGPGSKHKPHR